MKKTFLTVGIALSICSFALMTSSCHQDETVLKVQDVEEAARQIGFVSLEDLITIKNDKNTRSETTWNQYDPNAQPIPKDVTIFHAKIARASTGCKSGFGLCDIIIIGIPIGPQSPQSPATKNNYSSSILEFDTDTKRYYTDLLLKKSPESEGIEDMPPFIIDEEIETIFVKEDSIKILVPQSSIVFDKNLGEYGGYRIYMDKVEK